MEEKEVLEGNKLIAEFMGYKFDNDNFNHHNITKPAENDWFIASWFKEDIDKYILEKLTYHSSWDWLMPVIKKILEMYFDRRSEIYSGLHNVDIHETWRAVVAFLGFWNDYKHYKHIWKTTPDEVKDFILKQRSILEKESETLPPCTA